MTTEIWYKIPRLDGESNISGFQRLSRLTGPGVDNQVVPKPGEFWLYCDGGLSPSQMAESCAAEFERVFEDIVEEIQ